MYFNLWRYKVVRHTYSNLMIQPEPEGSTQGYPLVSIEVLRYDKMSKSEIKGRMQTEMELTLEQTQQCVSYEVSAETRIRKDGGEVKEFQRSFRHSDTERLSQSDEVLELKNFKKDATLKLFKSTNQEKYEHVSLKLEVPQDGKVTRWRNEIMLG
ncbi:hypothetical protein Tco_0115418 [Tanacetum coccineum]